MSAVGCTEEEEIEEETIILAATKEMLLWRLFYQNYTVLSLKEKQRTALQAFLGFHETLTTTMRCIGASHSFYTVFLYFTCLFL